MDEQEEDRLDELTIRYFERMFSEPDGLRNRHRMDDASVSVSGHGCIDERRPDKVYLHLRIVDGVIADVAFECPSCDPGIYVAVDILCELAKGMRFVDALNLDVGRDFSMILGGPSAIVSRHAVLVMERLKEAFALYNSGQDG